MFQAVSEMVQSYQNQNIRGSIDGFVQTKTTELTEAVLGQILQSASVPTESMKAMAAELGRGVRLDTRG